MILFNNFNFFKDEEEYNDTHPHKHEYAENSFSAWIHYKKVKECVQYDSNEQAKSCP